MKPTHFAATLLLASVFATASLAQDSQVHPGIALYEQGKYQEAIYKLKFAVGEKDYKKDPLIWNYLGLAYLYQGDYKKAKKMLEKAVKLMPNNSTYRSNLAYAYFLNRQFGKSIAETNRALELDPKNVVAYHVRGKTKEQRGDLNDAEADADLMIGIDPGYPYGYILKSDVLLDRLGKIVTTVDDIREHVEIIRQALDVLAIGVEKSRGGQDLKQIESKYEAIGALYKHFTNEKTKVPLTGSPPEPGVTPLRILSKPRAGFTDMARSANFNGRIKVVALLGAGGRVEFVMLLSRLGYGLDENALDAARRIQFEPKTVDGKAVSTVVIMEYSFVIY